MSKIEIENGRVKFTVDNEFEATLTLLGDGPEIPWILLNIKILVEDTETCENRLDSFDIIWLLNLLQSRVGDCDDPLLEVYAILHKFSQLLQLDVLNLQTWRLSLERLNGHIHYQYVKGRNLTISYWKEFASRELKTDLGNNALKLFINYCTNNQLIDLFFCNGFRVSVDCRNQWLTSSNPAQSAIIR